MTTVKDIYKYIEEFAPLAIAEKTDNPGFLVGDGNAQVNKVLVALDVSPEVVAEARSTGAQLIVTHHPVIFRPVKSVRRDGAQATLWELVHSGISAICMHTNLDSAQGGVNDALAETLGLKKLAVLHRAGVGAFKKIIVFVPRENAQAVREAMSAAGAGKLGSYDGCAFEADGRGYFRPLEGAKPYAGSVGSSEQVSETRIEAICASRDVASVVAAMKKAHPYEEPAYDVFTDEGVGAELGLGIAAQLDEERDLEEYARFVCSRVGASCAMVSRASGRVRHIAMGSGSWNEDMTIAAKENGADTIVAGELRHENVLLAHSLGMNVITAGHFETENVVCPKLVELIAKKFPDTQVRLADSDRSPSYYVRAAE
jgi:dinuclear metal center YbgI/SA1388 family protein